MLNPSLLEKQILATVSYYDILDYSLTGFEIWRYLISAPGHKKEGEVGDVFLSLNESDFLKQRISQKFGFYFLMGRDDLAEKRLSRKKLADQKWKKNKKVFKYLAMVPFVRGIFVSGSLAMENSKNESDVDVIIIAKKGRIWTVRTLMTVVTWVMGVRRHGMKTKDRICLNHYITDQSLKIPFESLYNAQSYAHLINVYADDANIFCDFQDENIWIRKFVENYKISKLGSARSIVRNKLYDFISRIFEKFFSGRVGDFCENLFSKIESKIIQKSPLYKKSGGRITIDNNQLEFHPDSHEAFIIPEFNSRMKKVGLLEFANQKNSGLD